MYIEGRGKAVTVKPFKILLEKYSDSKCII